MPGMIAASGSQDPVSTAPTSKVGSSGDSVAEERTLAHLGVEVDHQDARSGVGNGVGEVERQRRLAGPTLRVNDRDDLAGSC